MAAVPWSSCGLAEPSWRLDTLQHCSLAIAAYPRFRYDARGGGAEGVVASGSTPGRLSLCLANSVSIPALDWRSTRFLGLPLPPGLRIEILPDRLEGELNSQSGEVRLQFQARFRFQLQLGSQPVYTAPDLHVHTELRTDAVVGTRHRGRGEPIGPSGEAHLVGVAVIAPSGAAWLDRFLGLPDEALAELHCRFEVAG